jgi:hypothetical protein
VTPRFTRTSSSRPTSTAHLLRGATSKGAELHSSTSSWFGGGSYIAGLVMGKGGVHLDAPFCISHDNKGDSPPCGESRLPQLTLTDPLVLDAIEPATPRLATSVRTRGSTGTPKVGTASPVCEGNSVEGLARGGSLEVRP